MRYSDSLGGAGLCRPVLRFSHRAAACPADLSHGVNGVSMLHDPKRAKARKPVAQESRAPFTDEFVSLVTNEALASELADKAGVTDIADFRRFLWNAFWVWLSYDEGSSLTPIVSEQIRETRRAGKVFLKQLQKLQALPTSITLDRVKNFTPDEHTLVLEQRLSDFLATRAIFEEQRSAFKEIPILASSIEDFLATLPYFVRDLEDDGPRRGRQKGARANPALSAFVNMLGSAAYEVGGRLWVDKNTGEGPLIEALDLIRRHLIAKERLPAPGKHPMFAYKAALRRPRSDTE